MAYLVPPIILFLTENPIVSNYELISLQYIMSGAVPKAFIVLKYETSVDEIIAWTANQVVPYKRIKEIEFIEQIPKSPSGKILRRVLWNRKKQDI